MSTLTPYFNEIGVFALGAASALALTPVRTATSRATTFAINRLTGQFTSAQRSAREETQGEIYKAIDKALKSESAPEFIYLETADRLFFAKKGEAIIRLNLHNKESHYMQSRIQTMGLEDAYQYLTKARNNNDNDAHDGVNENEEDYYMLHSRMACSEVQKKMSDPNTIRSTAKAAITNLEALLDTEKTHNMSNSTTLAFYGKGKNKEEPSVIYIKPFSDNLRADFEQEGITHFDQVPSEEMLPKIRDLRKTQLAKYSENKEKYKDFMQPTIL